MFIVRGGNDKLFPVDFFDDIAISPIEKNKKLENEPKKLIKTNFTTSDNRNAARDKEEIKFKKGRVIKIDVESKLKNYTAEIKTAYGINRAASFLEREKFEMIVEEDEAKITDSIKKSTKGYFNENIEDNFNKSKFKTLNDHIEKRTSSESLTNDISTSGSYKLTKTIKNSNKDIFNFLECDKENEDSLKATACFSPVNDRTKCYSHRQSTQINFDTIDLNGRSVNKSKSKTKINPVNITNSQPLTDRSIGKNANFRNKFYFNILVIVEDKNVNILKTLKNMKNAKNKKNNNAKPDLSIKTKNDSSKSITKVNITAPINKKRYVSPNKKKSDEAITTLPFISTPKQNKLNSEINNIFEVANQFFKEDLEVKNKIDNLLQNIVDIKNVLKEKSKDRSIGSAPLNKNKYESKQNSEKDSNFTHNFTRYENHIVENKKINLNNFNSDSNSQTKARDGSSSSNRNLKTSKNININKNPIKVQLKLYSN